MEGYCRERISDDNPIIFVCSKKGKIAIYDPPGRHSVNDACTKLYGEIVEQEGRTYITYYTAFSKFESITKMIFNIIYLIMSLLASIFAVANTKPAIALITCVVCFVLGVRQLYVSVDEKGYAYQDSEIMIKVLEERVNAVNRWDA